jgi:ankyrin repeat protein
LTPKGKAAILSDNDGQISVSHADVFFHAIRGGDLAAVQRMLAAEPDLARAKSDQGVSPLLTAVYSGRNEIRDLLLSLEAPLDLHEAAATGNLERVHQFIDRNPQRAKEYSTDGFPVIALAAVFGHAHVVRYLFENGADVNAAAINGSGYNALTGAVTSGHSEIVEWLLAHGAEPNYRYGPSYSPSLAAAANGRLEILKRLVEHGADLQAQTNDGKTALDFAQERGHPEVAAYIQDCLSRASRSE